jgi:hypothetical protein
MVYAYIVPIKRLTGVLFEQEITIRVLEYWAAMQKYYLCRIINFVHRSMKNVLKESTGWCQRQLNSVIYIHGLGLYMYNVYSYFLPRYRSVRNNQISKDPGQRMCNCFLDASYQVSFHLAEGFQRRRLKCEKLTDDRRSTPDAKWWQKLTLPLARRAKKNNYTSAGLGLLIFDYFLPSDKLGRKHLWSSLKIANFVLIY